MGTTVLAGLRVLVVEDEMLISLLIEDILSDQQCVIVGPYDRLADALEAARTEVIDLAVLDVNIAGSKVYPIADVLAARKIPFLLLSGYGKSAIPNDHPDWRVCSKPFRSEELLNMLIDQVRNG
jgi:two-component SAPR family response regulator